MTNKKGETKMQVNECLYCPTNYDHPMYRGNDYDDKVCEAMDKSYDEALDWLSQHDDGKMLIAAILNDKKKFEREYEKFMDRT
jgi:hypothetical protein